MVVEWLTNMNVVLYGTIRDENGRILHWEMNECHPLVLTNSLLLKMAIEIVELINHDRYPLVMINIAIGHGHS